MLSVVRHGLNFFQFSTLEIQVSDYLGPMENSILIFQFSGSDYHLVKPSLTKHVSLVRMGTNSNN